MSEKQQLLIYQSESCSTRIDVMLEAETFWLNLTDMASVPPSMMKPAMPVSLSPTLSRKRAREIRFRSANFTFKQLTELFGKAKGTISEHIKHIFENGELVENSVVRFFRTTAADGKQYYEAHSIPR